MKKFAIVVVVLVVLIFLFGPDLKGVFKKTSPSAEEKARKLCALMEERNEEMKKLVHAALFLEKNIMERKEVVEKLEENFKKLEKGEELIKEAEGLIGEAQLIKGETAKTKWLVISHKWKEIMDIHFGVSRVMGEVVSAYPKTGEEWDHLMKSKDGHKSNSDV